MWKLNAVQFQAVLESMVEGVIVLDAKGNIAFLNPALEKIFSIRRDSYAGRPLLEAVRNPELYELYIEALRSTGPVSREINMLLPVRRVFRVNAASLGEQGVAMILNDITEIRRLETVRKDFVANVSHELKTPLTSIKGFVETLLDGAIDDKENNRAFLRIIREQALRLEALITDLLSLSRLESGQIRLDIREFELPALVEGVLQDFCLRLKEKDIEVSKSFIPALTVKADKEKLRQALSNLVDNAIKFNRRGGVINISMESSHDSLKVIVEDSGCGIPEKDVPRIFERFYRASQPGPAQEQGSGLGLAIVKHIIELHKGSVGSESLEGRGSKFYFYLPK